MTSNFVKIGNEYYAPTHKKALALQRSQQSPNATACPSVAVISGDKVAKRLRQKSGPKMNKLEQEYHARLQSDPRYREVCVQSMKFEIGNGVWYCPDFICSGWASDRLYAFETKGFMRDDAAVKIKVAAKMFQFIHWQLVWKDKGQWQIQTIIP